MAHQPSIIMSTADKKAATADLKPQIIEAKEAVKAATAQLKQIEKAIKVNGLAILALQSDIEIGSGAKAALKEEDVHWKKAASLKTALELLPGNKASLKEVKAVNKELAKLLKIDQKALAAAEKALAGLIAQKEALKL